ncbi:MAG TPA: D-alanine--D-alanine ligase, partial [Candidatus Paceibacterota bacterium]
MNRIRVGVLRGGPSSEYEVSLKTGAAVINHIPRDIYDIQDIFISRDGVWHKNGAPIVPHNIFPNLDVVFNALHGQYGEDGKVQHILEMHKIPFTGSGSFSSVLGMNKVLSKSVFEKNKIKTPQYRLIENPKDISNKENAGTLIELFRFFPLPLVVKPVSAGSSIGITMVKDFSSFESAIKKAGEHSSSVMIEEYIPGIEATVGVIDNYRNEETYALPPIEIRPKNKTFFDYEAKYGGATNEIVPGNFEYEDKLKLEDIAKKVHNVLGLRHYSRADFIVSPSRGIYVLEANTLPGLTEESLLPKALKA